MNAKGYTLAELVVGNGDGAAGRAELEREARVNRLRMANQGGHKSDAELLAEVHSGSDAPGAGAVKSKSHKAKSLSEMLYGGPCPTATKGMKGNEAPQPVPGSMEALLFGSHDKSRSEPAYQPRDRVAGSAFAAGSRSLARVNRAGSGGVYVTPTKGPYSS
jgi:hypothetical protein